MQEVFKSDFYDAASFNKVLGKCCVLFVKDYFKYKPEVCTAEMHNLWPVGRVGRLE